MTDCENTALVISLMVSIILNMVLLFAALAEKQVSSPPNVNEPLMEASGENTTVETPA